MDEVALAFFPYPYVSHGVRHAGAQIAQAKPCSRCDRQCERLHTTTIGLCSYGVNYTWFDKDLLVYGVVVGDATQQSAARSKVIRQQDTSKVATAQLEDARRRYLEFANGIRDDIEARKQAIVEEYRDKERYKEDFLLAMKPQIARGLAYFHDYRQFIARMKENINVILEQRYPGVEMGQKLAGAGVAERAIYWGSELMGEKLRTAEFLLSPEDITDRRAYACFKLHGLVIKYVRMYEASFAQKDVKIVVCGESVGEMVGNPAAVAVIPHTFIDNALKYSSRGSRVQVEFSEDSDNIELSVSSFGPEIAPDERERIFDIFYRARAAQDQEKEGAGFGLYLARFIARQMSTDVVVKQSPEKTARGYSTVFSARFARER